MWGELARHQRRLTHRPSSQGLASKCIVLFMFICRVLVCLGLYFHVIVVPDVSGWLGCLPTYLANVLYTCIIIRSMYSFCIMCMRNSLIHV